MEDKINEVQNAFFAPQLTIHDVAKAIDFYKKAFNAVELRRFENEDGSVHVAELKIENNLFHLHEDNRQKGELNPDQAGGTTVIIGLFLNNPDKLFNSAIEAGGHEISPMQDYEYGYRQGRIKDPFGHYWMLEKKI